VSTNESNQQTIAQFSVGKILPRDTGYWIYSVKTEAGMTDKQVYISVKVAPYPQCGPKLNKSGPNYLNIDVNIDSYGGDGPIARVTILYKPSKKPTPWNILVVPITDKIAKLENLEPRTEYKVCVQLGRKGDVGVGHPGPESLFTTEAFVAPYPQCGPKLNKSGPNYLNIDVNIDSYGGDGPIARVTILYKPSKKPTPWNILVVPITDKIAKLENLEPRTEYKVCVQLGRKGDVGVGHPGPESLFTTEAFGLPPPKDLSLTPNSQTSLGLTWLPNWEGSEEEHVSQAECFSPDNPETTFYKTAPGNVTGIIIDGLKPKTLYQCRVRVNTKPQGEWSEPMFAWTYSDQIPPTASNINVLNVTDSTAIITWSIQEGHSITTVIIRYKIFDDTGYNHDIKIRNITITQYQLKGLEADTIY
ncbi:hypothetical protein AB205_0023560, partial [Aquarana catesbeiana]